MIPNAHLYENIELEYYGLVSYFPDQNYADPTDMEMKDISIKIFYKGIEIAETTTVSPIPYADELP